jgi:Glycine zipper
LPSIRLNFTSLFELLAAQINGLDGAHVGDAVERIFLQHEQVGGLTLGQRAEFFVDAQGLRGALREGLDHLNRCQARLHHHEHHTKGAAIGGLGGAAAGGLVGSAVRHPVAGALVGGGLGAGGGALIGNQLQGHEEVQQQQQEEINRQSSEVRRQREELQRLKKQGEY